MVAGSPAIKPVNLRSPALSIFSKAKPRSCICAFTAAADEPHGMSANAMSLLPLAAAFGSASNAQVNANALIMTSLSDLTPQRKNTPNARWQTQLTQRAGKNPHASCSSGDVHGGPT